MGDPQEFAWYILHNKYRYRHKIVVDNNIYFAIFNFLETRTSVHSQTILNYCASRLSWTKVMMKPSGFVRGFVDDAIFSSPA